MTKLVSLEQASDYIRRDTTDDDAMLASLIEAASGLVLNYLKANTHVDFIDSDGEIVEEDTDGVAVGVDAAVQSATLYMTAWLYRNRDADPTKDFAPGYLPAPVTAMLFPLRDPTLI